MASTWYIRRMIQRCTRWTIRWSSEELVREVCPHGFLRLHSPHDPVWVHGMRRTFRRMQWSCQITFGTGVYILWMFRRRRQRSLRKGVRPSSVWGPLNGYLEKVQRLLAPDDPTLAFLHTSDHPMNGNFVCFFQQLD